jgi:uncharacterized membrane protein YqiK
MLSLLSQYNGGLFTVGGAAALLFILALLLFWQRILWLFGVILVPNDSIGLVTKKFTLFGKSTLPDGRIIALDGEAGQQADTLASGLHLGLWPWQYQIAMRKFLIVPPGQIGVVVARDGNPLPSGRIVGQPVTCDFFQDARAFIEAGGERGPQMTVIPPGSYRVNELLFDVELADALTVPPGKLGIVEAMDGAPMLPGRVIARSVECDSFQDGGAFIASGGQRGPQMTVIPPGSYRINPLLFDVAMTDVLDIPQNRLGIVTTREGAALPTGEIAGPEIKGHNSFQDPQAFLDMGGMKGLQEQVLLAGRYFINPRFATVEIIDMVEVPIAHVGVVIAFVGKDGRDVTGDSFRHGNLVTRGEKGVWVTPLD